MSVRLQAVMELCYHNSEMCTQFDDQCKCFLVSRFVLLMAPCGLRGCKNRAHSVSWPEVVRGVPNQGLDCFVS